jgi:DNA modification methylase
MTGQSTTEAEYIISHLTVENQVVLDPFVGSGTTAIAALKLNRKIIGTEIQEDIFNMAKNRIAEFISSKSRHEPMTEEKSVCLWKISSTMIIILLCPTSHYLRTA